MQGRLSRPSSGKIQCFPRDSWAEEFPRAAAIGLRSIEWLYDVHGEDVNPLATDQGLGYLRALSAEHVVVLRSVCADWFKDRPLLRCIDPEKRECMQQLEWLLGRCGALGIEWVMIHCVDESAMHTAAEEDEVVAILRTVLPIAEAARVQIQLETTLGPQRFRTFLNRLPSPQVAVTAVDFPAVFSELRRIDYGNGFVLQVARAATGDEMAWARRNRDWVLHAWDESAR